MGQRDDSYQSADFAKLDKETQKWMDLFEVEFKQILEGSMTAADRFHRPPHISEDFHRLLIRLSALEYWTRWKMAVSATVWERMAKKLNAVAERIEQIMERTEELKGMLDDQSQ